MAEEPNTSMEQSGDDGDQEVVTIEEVLQSQQQMMDDANAVLGAIDDKKCTYAEGYMKRQALYSCLTCIPEAKSEPNKGGGICLACSYYCHEGHELIELYTKRNFRCDCGNTKFPNRTCTLETTKADINELNEYNQNFSGVYCTCKRPFPDAEDTIDDDMIQCIICEDWYHSRHLGTEIPPNSSYTEMTCEACVKKHEFLLHYEGMCVNKVSSDEKAEVEIEGTAADETATVSSITEDAAIAKREASISMEIPADVSNSENVIKDQETNESLINDADSTEPTTNSINTSAADANSIINNDNVEKCIMPTVKSEKASTKFWADVDWRKQLCNCPKCLKMYEEEKVMYLLDSQDTVPVYEEKGKAKAREFEAKQHDDDMKFLNSLNRVPLMEAIAGFNDMKTNLMQYLKKFAENGKIVREEDIREFFSSYDVKKKQKCEMPHYCR